LRLRRAPAFRREFARWLREYAGRPTPLYFADHLSRRLGGARIYLKREDLLHTGAHKINNTIGQALLARRLKKTRLIAETVAGPHPYPLMVREFQAVIGEEARRQVLGACGRLPDACIACVGGGSNALGLFHAFRRDRRVELIGVEAAGRGLETGAHAASLTA